MRLMPADDKPNTAPSSTAPNCKRNPIDIADRRHLKQRPSAKPDIRAERAAVTLAIATGTRLRGLNSNSSSSTASKIAATGVANVADMPAAAPATNSVVRSASVRRIHCAISDPNAPPVIMIGPSAPNGPPEPIAMPPRSVSVPRSSDPLALDSAESLRSPPESRAPGSCLSQTAPSNQQSVRQAPEPRPSNVPEDCPPVRRIPNSTGDSKKDWSTPRSNAEAAPQETSRQRR